MPSARERGRGRGRSLESGHPVHRVQERARPVGGLPRRNIIHESSKNLPLATRKPAMIPRMVEPEHQEPRTRLLRRDETFEAAPGRDEDVLHDVVHVAGRDELAKKKAAEKLAVFEVKAAKQGVRGREVCLRRADLYRCH